MNKIKLLYDVVMTMKEKDSCSGAISVEGRKDQVKILDFNNEFEKNMTDGQTKAKINFELEHEGKKVKHESSTEFNTHTPGRCHHGFMSHMRFHHCHGHQFNHMEGLKRCGMKEKLSRIGLLLNILNSLKVEEQENKNILLSLNFDEIRQDIKNIIQEKLQHEKMARHHDFHGAVKEFSALENPTGSLNILINKNNEVEEILLTLDGEKKGELNQVHLMNIKAELRLNR
ncbi:hypothetical protein DCCM_3877 [Desulfocucumis palustris]|uniref:Uncharacterized protein n=1 Tax=Desulfocucumis palustris TaxID=1898651 RepID=A0A2L2XEJ1_9FIRM|nr:hypothetical protein [Desulfocucumis palustris]GBF34757.1 hypothetical protein DCCM_3877 [Desulfocucumis palustris]